MRSVGRAALRLALFLVRLARRRLEERIGGAYDPRLSAKLDRLVVAEEVLLEAREDRG